MSIVVKMDMPKSCCDCDYLGSDWTCQNYIADCFDDDVSQFEDCRHEYCPIIAGFPKNHGDLIDRDKLLKNYDLENCTKYGNQTKEQQIHSYDTLMMYEIADMIEDAETIIKSEVK